jgi:glyoxylase-like metal-dependent hydrolase (beta-lactamase superfamily II)
MYVKMYTVGLLETNCFLVANSESKEAIIIDPGFSRGSEVNPILDDIKCNEFKVKFVVNTHWHPDHTKGNHLTKELTKAPLLIHEYDAPLLAGSIADKILREGDLIEFGAVKLRVLHTPGHSRGSICLLDSEVVFSGDTLFAGSIGRYDLPDGSLKALMNSIKKKLMILPDYVKVYPGHGPISTIGEERRNNPFLQDFFKP